MVVVYRLNHHVDLTVFSLDIFIFTLSSTHFRQYYFPFSHCPLNNLIVVCKSLGLTGTVFTPFFGCSFRLCGLSFNSSFSSSLPWLVDH